MMKSELLVFLFLFSCSSSNEVDKSRSEIPDIFRKEQVYPSGVSYWNYYESIPKEIKNLVDELYFLEEGASVGEHSPIKSENFRSITHSDTVAYNTQYDRFGNVTYKENTLYSAGIHIRYKINEAGQLVERKQFEDKNKRWTNFKFTYSSDGLFKEVHKESEDSTITYLVEYNSSLQITRAGSYTYRYDDRGNCVEGWIKYNFGHCGDVLTHWEKKYDLDNNLVFESNNVSELHSINEDIQNVNPSPLLLEIDSVFNKDNVLTQVNCSMNDSVKYQIEFEYFD